MEMTHLDYVEEPRRRSQAEALVVDLPVAEAVAALAIVAGLLLRLPGLTGMPLQSTEAGRALQAFSAIRGEGVDVSSGPLLVYAQAALFFLFTASDAAARL